MMKTTYKITTLGHALAALALAGALSSCVMERLDPNCEGTGDGSLSLLGTVSDGTVVTRAKAVEDLKEKALNTLDVFVEEVDNPGTFIRQYHLPYTNGSSVAENTNNFLADNWRAEGLKIGKKYNIYVATNNPLTKEDVASVEALKALTYDEVSAGVAVINEDNDNVTWGDDVTSGNIYKLYNANPGNNRALTSEKEFMMDGILENWTPTAGAKDQVFKTVTLNRAAAKIVLNVKFDKVFLRTLTENMKVEGKDTTWTEKSADKKVTITGSPAWKFYNFAFGAPVFAPQTQGAGVEVHNADFNIFHNQTCENGASFQIVTYTYPNTWVKDNYATDAPSIVLSVGYTENGKTTYNYYRVPLVKHDVTEINRNHIYVINATIATKGSELHDDVDEIDDVVYNVLPWNDETNDAAIHNEVEAVQHYYLKVNPKIYTLRGDGEQSVNINFLKANGTSVGWKLFTYDANGNQTSVVANDATGATRAWFYNANGNFTTTYSDTGSGITWDDTMGVTITPHNEGTSGSGGYFEVKSQALTNKAIKYIRFRVYLNEMETLYEDVIIRHFPTDNIQNIAGSWSSYHTASGSATSMVTLETFSLSEAQSWAAQYGVDYTTEEIDVVDNITYSEYTAHAGESGYAIASAQATTDGSTFRTNVPNATQRAAANSQANAVLGTDGYCYWGTNPQVQGYYYSGYELDNYDYYTVYSNDYWYWYNYQNYYRARYTHTYKQTQYSLTVEMASTGNWVDWDRDANQTYSGNNRKINGNDNFFAKAYSDGIINAIVVNRDGNSKTYTLKHGNNYEYYYYWDGSQTRSMQTYFNATNNHMYVIQISSTSDKYVLGRPVLGNPDANRSLDDVVSPAFMIASQLGAVIRFTGDNAPKDAADHCGQYMEVGTDGTRYTGWRLPTRSEINVINGYQKGVINGVDVPFEYQTMIEVLGGERYWSLAGQRIRTSDGEVVQSGDTYLRCVRDLSAKEIERLNGFDRIIEKYQNK